MNPNKQHLDTLFDKFITGAATPEEKTLIWKWIYLLDVRQQQTMYTVQEKELVRENMRSRILQQMGPAGGRHVSLPLYAIAASILILIAVGAFWFISGSPKNDRPIRTIVSAGNKMRSFYLPDSTQVMLNMASTLQWNSDYNTKERKVVLTGEGYFKVHKDKQRPFIVESNGILTRALGTAFNIESYNQESEVRVALLEGTVQVGSIHQLFPAKILQSGELLRFSHNDATAQVQAITAGNAIAWTTGGMSFHAIPLTEALDRLATRYNITIQYDRQKLQSKRVSGNFKTSPWQELLPNILFIHNLHYEVKKNLIRIY